MAAVTAGGPLAGGPRTLHPEAGQRSGPGPPGAASSGSGPALECCGPSQFKPALLMAQLCSPAQWGFPDAEGHQACRFSAAPAVGALTRMLFKRQPSVDQNKTGSFEVATSRRAGPSPRPAF